VLACVLLLTGALPAGYYVLAVMIAAVFAGAAIIDWSRARKQPVTFHDDKEDEDA
jgi:hypothetical protein